MSWTARTVQPRAGGEQGPQAFVMAAMYGSAPRRRGTGTLSFTDSSCDRFSPAQAGNRAREGSARTLRTVQPRAGGEQLVSTHDVGRRYGSAPRRRGTGHGMAHDRHRERFSPAQAGNSPARLFRARMAPVQPRAGGEQPRWHSGGSAWNGSAPRRRGTGAAGDCEEHPDRFSPAQAGNSPARLFRARMAPVQPRAGGEQPRWHSGGSAWNGSAPRRRGTGAAGDCEEHPDRFSPAQAGNSRQSA